MQHNWLIKSEKIVNDVLAWTKVHRDATKLGLGTAILLYGHHFPSTILMIASVRIVGVGGFKKQFNYLGETFRRTVKAVKDSAPELESQLQEIRNLTNELAQLKAEFDSGKMTAVEYQSRSVSLQAKLAHAQDIEKRMKSTFQVISAAVDPAGLQEVLGQMYASIASCVAAASSKYFRFCSIGFSIGHVIADRLVVVLQARKDRIEKALKQGTCVSMKFITDTVAHSNVTGSQSSASTSATIDAVGSQATEGLLYLIDTKDWITPTAGIVGNGIGWLIAYYMQSLSSAISACSLGSEMVISACQSLLDPILLKNNLPSTRSEQMSETVALVQSGLIGFGITRIIYSRGLFGSSSLGAVGSILLFPLVVTEKVVNATFTTLGVAATAT